MSWNLGHIIVEQNTNKKACIHGLFNLIIRFIDSERLCKELATSVVRHDLDPIYNPCYGRCLI